MSPRTAKQAVQAWTDATNGKAANYGGFRSAIRTWTEQYVRDEITIAEFEGYVAQYLRITDAE
jgi:hypothetical protein